MRNPHIGVALRQSAGPQTWSAKAEGAPFPLRAPHDPSRIRRKLAPCPEIDCIRHLLPPGIIAAAELRAIEIDTGADHVLVSQNTISHEQYVRALAVSLGVRYDALLHIPRSACPADDLALIETVKSGLLRLVIDHRLMLAIAPHDILARHLIKYVQSNPDFAAEICLTSSQHLFEFVRKHTSETVTQNAVSGLKSSRPDLSANVPPLRNARLPACGCLAAIAALIYAPIATILAVHVALALIFMGWTILRLIGAATSGIRWHKHRTILDHELPIYSVIVALYREPVAVGGLVESLRSLDYPLEKLDIKFVLEADDRQTRHALSRLPLGSAFTILTAPDRHPRTKPKALNIALPFVRGSYVTVFDAEDRPERDQLKKAVHAFRAGGERLACVQARLTIDNYRETWITRMFAAEYAGLFDVFLPGIAAWRLPLPLGGSSNHFRTSTLTEMGAWDPYNVTEDADLGMRLARLGHHTAVIDSTTYEEAPSRFMPWLKQRTRWFKGWMQTWLVHTRHPVQLWRDLGSRGFLTFQLVVGGTILAAMVHGVFAVALGWQITSGWLWAEKAGIGEMIVSTLHTTTLVSGYMISAMLGMLGLIRRRMMPCAWALLFMPVYWLMLSVAAWRALFHLIFDPYDWEKTEHNLARPPVG